MYSPRYARLCTKRQSVCSVCVRLWGIDVQGRVFEFLFCMFCNGVCVCLAYVPTRSLKRERQSAKEAKRIGERTSERDDMYVLFGLVHCQVSLP